MLQMLLTPGHHALSRPLLTAGATAAQQPFSPLGSVPNLVLPHEQLAFQGEVDKSPLSAYQPCAGVPVASSVSPAPQEVCAAAAAHSSSPIVSSPAQVLEKDRPCAITEAVWSPVVVAGISAPIKAYAACGAYAAATNPLAAGQPAGVHIE
jgi:hypothetical protein